MRLRDVPVAQRRGFIFVEAEVDAELDLGEPLGEAQVGRSRVDGVGVEDDEQINQAGVHIRDQLAQRRHLIDRPCGCGVSVEHRAAHIAQGVIHGMRQRMHDGRLLETSDDDAGAPMSTQIVGDRAESMWSVPL